MCTIIYLFHVSLYSLLLYSSVVPLSITRPCLMYGNVVMMEQRPKSHFQHPEKTYQDPSNIMWEITWRNLLAVESHQSAAHGPCLLLHLRRSSKSFARTVKCQSGNAEAGISHLQQISNTLHRLWKEYGPDRESVASEVMKVNEWIFPYSPFRLHIIRLLFPSPFEISCS
jgi:hypothetical protein